MGRAFAGTVTRARRINDANRYQRIAVNPIGMRTAPVTLNKAFAAVFAEARKGITKGHGGPFGALILRHGRIIAAAHNTVLKDNDPTSHAEVNAIRKAAKKLKTPHLTDCVLVTSSEPCDMCRATIRWARIPKVHFACSRRMAERYGFKESGAHDTRIEMIHERAYTADGGLVFEEWERRKGKIY